MFQKCLCKQLARCCCVVVMIAVPLIGCVIEAFLSWQRPKCIPKSKRCDWSEWTSLVKRSTDFIKHRTTVTVQDTMPLVACLLAWHMPLGNIASKLFLAKSWDGQWHRSNRSRNADKRHQDFAKQCDISAIFQDTSQDAGGSEWQIHSCSWQ